MCTSPLHITPRSFRYLVYSRQIVVPCGKCPDCITHKANDLYVRARMEYNASIKAGGCGFMCCLTYSDDLLHWITLPSGEKRSVFCKQDVILFIKRLRINLDRYYFKHFNLKDGFADSPEAPDFKYLITSEYGTDPTRSHRPHYHLLFFFKKPISPTLFKRKFRQSLCSKDMKTRYFGYVHQCDLIDPQKGGIRYSSKYVCKDITYKPQDEFIRDKIKFYKKQVNEYFNIIHNPQNSDDDFKNKVIRSTDIYKKAVEKNVRPWRHMLQFYMVSNDLGGSVVVDKYGLGLINMPLLNFDGFPYQVPNIVKKRFEERYGIKYFTDFVKKSFMTFLQKVMQDDLVCVTFNDKQRQDLRVFAQEYIIPYRGNLKLVLPDLDNFEDRFLHPVRDWEEVIDEFNFYEDNDFLRMKDDLETAIQLYNREDNLRFQYHVKKARMEKNQEDYEKRKRNYANSYSFY